MLHLCHGQENYYRAYRQWLLDESRVHVTGFGTGTLTLEYGTYKKQFKEEEPYISFYRNRINWIEDPADRMEVHFLQGLADSEQMTVSEYLDSYEALQLMDSEAEKGNTLSEAEALMKIQKKRGMYQKDLGREEEHEFLEQLAKKADETIQEQMLLTYAMWHMDEQAAKGHMVTEQEAIATVEKTYNPDEHQFLLQLSQRVGISIAEQIHLTKAMWLMDEVAEQGKNMEEAEALRAIQLNSGVYLERTLKDILALGLSNEIQEEAYSHFMVVLYIVAGKLIENRDAELVNKFSERLIHAYLEILGPIEDQICGELHKE